MCKKKPTNIFINVTILSFSISLSIAVSKAGNEFNEIPGTLHTVQQTAKKQKHLSTQGYAKLYRKIFPYTIKAKRAGIKVDNDEIEKRAAVYKIVYPNNSINPGQIEDQLMVEKYFKLLGKLKADSQKVVQTYGKLSPNKNLELLSPVELNKAIKAEVFFNSQGYLAERKRHTEIQYFKNQEHFNNRIPHENLILNGASDICIAKNLSDNTCFVTVQEFNARVLLLKSGYPKSVNIKRVRKAILQNYISEKLITQKLRKNNLKINSDSLLTSAKTRRKKVRMYIRTKAFGPPVRNEKKLREIYKRNYKELFQTYKKATLQIIGSSDSLFIDSLHKKLLILEKVKNLKKQKLEKPNPNFRWVSIHEDKLPWTLVAPTLEFKKGQFSTPIKSNFGYFISKMEKIDFIPEVSYEEAKEQCRFLATRENFFKMDSIVEAKSRAYYAENIERFQTPDTLELKAWLIPSPLKNSKYSKEKIKNDTSRYSAIKLSSLSLPENTRNKLETAIKRGKKNEFYGPIKDIYGIWYFKIHKSKTGGRQIPFFTVRQRIIEKITALNDEKPEIDTLVTEELKDEVLLSMVIPKVHKVRKVKDIRSLPDSEVLDMADSENIADHDFSSSDTSTHKINKIKEKLIENIIKQNAREYKDFLQNIEIATHILNQ